MAGEVSRCEKEQTGLLSVRPGRLSFVHGDESVACVPGQHGRLPGGWDKDLRKGRGVRLPTGGRGSHLYLYLGGRGLGTSFCREAGRPG